ncbi:MAG TPA: RlmE family RNA methyltransferase [Candidatus Lokiarchaeia archaeon]|nr:RlmE family RNA methyltransferase [Candidatus Lokiarchaeia archaeon]
MGKKRGQNYRPKPHRQEKFYVQAKDEGYRARAIFKLKEIDEKYHLFENARCVVDLCCAPGSWLEYCVETLQNSTPIDAEGGFYVLGVDQVYVRPFEGMDLIRADITRDDISDLILGKLPAPADLLLSDCAPHESGQRAADADAQAYLFEKALAIADRVLAPGGAYVGKLLQGAEFNHLLEEMRVKFAKVANMKPKASRPGSPEMYVIGKGFRPNRS